MRLLLDPEGRRVALSHNTKTVSHDERAAASSEDKPFVLPQVSSSALWERMLARLCQRVQEVETLIYEDLGDIEEPLGTLGSREETLTPEQVNQWKAAKEAYAQAPLECSRALARILLPFGRYLETREHRSEATGCESSPVETSEKETFLDRCQASNPMKGGCAG